MSADEQPRKLGPVRLRSARWYVGINLALYWIALFVATHAPLPELPIKAEGSDKVAHLVGYAGLGLLLGVWSALGRPLTLLRVLMLIAILAAYGAFDEWLQQFVNRHTDFADWVADVIGATAGVLFAWVLQSLAPLPQNQTGERDRFGSDSDGSG